MLTLVATVLLCSSLLKNVQQIQRPLPCTFAAILGDAAVVTWGAA